MSNHLRITHYYLLRFGAFNSIPQGDYYEHLFPNKWLAIAHCADQQDIFLVEGFNLPLKIFNGMSFWDVAYEIGAWININENLDFTIGLLRSTFDGDPDGLIDAGLCVNSIGIYREDEVIHRYECSIYTICSRTDFIDEPIFSMVKQKVLLSDGIECALGDLYGRIDEDQTWFVLVNSI